MNKINNLHRSDKFHVRGSSNLGVGVFMVEHKLGVSEFVEYPRPNRSPDVKEAVVVSACPVTTQHRVRVRSHIVVEDRVEPIHVNLIWAVPRCRVVRRKVSTIKVSRTLRPFTCIFWHGGVELSDVTGMLK